MVNSPKGTAMQNNESNLLVLPWSPDLPGGVSVVVRNLASVWEDAGIPHAILVSDWASKRASSDEKGRLRLKLAIFGRLSPVGLLKSALLWPVTLGRTFGLLKKRGVTAVYFHYATLDSFGVALLKRLGLFKGRLILCFHGTDVRKPRGRLESILWNVVFNASDAITACSNSLARGVEQTFALPEGRVVTIYNGVDTAVFSRRSNSVVPEQNVFGKGSKPYIVSVGSFIERKGHKFLIEAFARISGAFPDLGLVIVGMDGDQRPALEAQVEALGLQDSVRFRVNLHPVDVAALVGGAALCVQPSIAEPFGMAVIEAGAAGVCVAASAVGGHTELISHQQTGFLFDASDASGIESVLLEALQDDDRRTRIAEAFHVKVVSGFSWQVCADRYRSSGFAMPQARLNQVQVSKQ